MALIDTIIGMASTFLMYAGATLLLILVIGGISLPILIRRMFPIPFIHLKNAGGARNNNSIVLDAKIWRRGRIVNTEYGQRVKILGLKNTQSMNIVNRDNAIPYEGGGVAFMIYEKEVGQLFPVNPQNEETIKDLELVMSNKKAENKKVEQVYKWLLSMHPELSHAFHLRAPKSVIAPVSFSNHEVKLRPFPIDAVTSYMTDARLRRERAMRQGWWDKWGQSVVMLAIVGLVIVTTVLTYEQANKAAELRVKNAGGTVPQQEQGFGENMAGKIGGGETPPGGSTG